VADDEDDGPCVHQRDRTHPLGWFAFRFRLPCSECAAEAHKAWVEQVRGKLLAGLEAAAGGRRIEWDDPPPKYYVGFLGAPDD
jgi:hypothetical protein